MSPSDNGISTPTPEENAKLQALENSDTSISQVEIEAPEETASTPPPTEKPQPEPIPIPEPKPQPKPEPVAVPPPKPVEEEPTYMPAFNPFIRQQKPSHKAVAALLIVVCIIIVGVGGYFVYTTYL